jgi:hypothetical protein
MNYTNIKVFTFLFIFIYTLCFAQETKEVDPVKSFKEYLSHHFESYKIDKREQLAKLGGGWVKEYYEPETDYKVDVQRTNSLITPYTGFCEFTLTRHLTTFHNRKEDANNDNFFIKSDQFIHKHYYGYQEGEWIVTAREHKKVGSMLSGWYDCNEVLKVGEQKGETNLNGCWEKED